MVLKMAYMSTTKENLPIYGIPKVKGLGDFCTSQSDAARGISRVPLILARLYDEDMKIEKPKSSFGSAQKYVTSPSVKQAPDMSEEERLINNLGVTMTHRNNAQRNSYRERQASVDRFQSTRVSNTLDSDFDQRDEFENRLSSS